MRIMNVECFQPLLDTRREGCEMSGDYDFLPVWRGHGGSFEEVVGAMATGNPDVVVVDILNDDELEALREQLGENKNHFRIVIEPASQKVQTRATQMGFEVLDYSKRGEWGSILEIATRPEV